MWYRLESVVELNHEREIRYLLHDGSLVHDLLKLWLIRDLVLLHHFHSIYKPCILFPHYKTIIFNLVSIIELPI